MSEKIDQKLWAKEFAAFMNSSNEIPPAHLTQSILEYVRKDLNPDMRLIMVKLSAIHVIIGSLSLLVCTQFGMGVGEGPLHIFMKFGDLFCIAMCGALFLGLTSIIAGVVLSDGELGKIRKAFYLPFMTLGTISLFIFTLFGAEVALNVSISWLIGGCIASIIISESSIRIRRLTRQFA
ncbi:hypothetical protein KA183_20120 [bacterium]|nr:hypothetical protein [bacterium]